ncbi:MAG: GlsB/YeaQ/YmgE family stress response membrane protein [Bacteroidetes bacterium]|nr:GlsB/YeaQ/YmgE family stress response membrane protein [Bacteroidota bacterium]MBU2586231.1 GlsB/YeaQ/YmgE family stress response membrane protein [Bacteroidota bacterium]
MIAMSFFSFLILLIISLVVSAILHFLLKYYVRPGINSFISKVIFGWIGAWLGSPVFGHWFEGWNYEGVYYIPAILGSFAFLIILVDFVKSVKTTST